ncbi:unnamed protein product [Hermetia illucens]|uniref:Arf-GAP domain-containing protein n=1 Tax=Hermetia illucens TaxID=343691 RepID=A0A7R8YXW8_HERIL|nr:stromal membrane-associated protein 1-like [Hermetia illucens]CAD7088337.1 unnamed protein product [Hermetia illucens]
MSGRKETERAKLIQEKCQTLLTQMLRDEDNKYCVDCDAKGPRWASWNLGVFLCIRCAGIHRKLGVHISRVKSVNLDSWTPEQVISLQQMGNSRARAVYEAQLPDGFRRPQTDSALESFIRAKYEHKKYLAREWVPPSPPKVDWAKEIDEEIERQKRKKKAAQGASSLGLGGPLSSEKKITATTKPVPIPAPLPKPKSSNSPKTSRTVEPIHNNSDLLGLTSPTNPSGPSSSVSNDLHADGFSGFLSAPVAGAQSSTINGATEKASENKENALDKEEADFFNQTSINSGSDKTKMTKDSILALYGTAPTSTIGQFNNNPLVGFNNTFSHQQPAGAAGQYMPQQQAFPAIVPGGAPPPVSQAQFGHAGLATNLNLNLAGMPPGLLGPPQPHPHTQFMTPPNSVTMYNQPVMTAPGAFTSAAVMHQQVVPSQPASFAQFPPQPFGAMPTGFGPPPGAGTNVTASTQSTASTNLSQQFGNLNLGNVWQ